MKSLKPLLLVLAGVLIAGALFSFQKANIQNEFIIISAPAGTIRVYSNGEIIEEAKYALPELSKILNKYGQEGWVLKSSLSHYSGVREFYLERVKQ